MKPIFIIMAFFLLLLSTVSAASIMPVACDDGRVVMTNSFADGEDACLYGTGFSPEASMDLYVVDDAKNYTLGEPYDDVSGGAERAQANDRGVLRLWKVWEEVKQGFYDFVADLNLDGRYDEGDIVNAATFTPQGLDADDSIEEQMVEEVPEFSTLAAFFVLVFVGIYMMRRRSA